MLKRLQTLDASGADPVPGAPQAARDDLSRKVFGLLGIPVDAVDFPSLLRSVDGAAAARSPFLISTPNVNFLVRSQADSDVRGPLGDVPVSTIVATWGAGSPAGRGPTDPSATTCIPSQPDLASAGSMSV